MENERRIRKLFEWVIDLLPQQMHKLMMSYIFQLFIWNPQFEDFRVFRNYDFCGLITYEFE